MKDKSIVILTGAGISAESGIRTFRAEDGLWEEQRVEDVATPEGFVRNPRLVQSFYNDRRRQLDTVGPHAAHMALGKLEQEYDGLVTVVTQNIDNLHERGGSKRVIHMHGELLKSLCASCGDRQDLAGDLALDAVCPSCGRQGTLRPDIVWFGEIPYRMDEIITLLERCSLFISIGTSGNVYPAAGFVQTAIQSGSKTIEVNPNPSLVHSYFDEQRCGKAGEMVPPLVQEILTGALSF